MIGRLTPCEIEVICVLGERGGWTDSETLARLTGMASQMYDHARPRKTVRVHVFNIREKLGDGAIICIPGRGYTLGEPGVRAYRAHLAAKAAWAAA